MESVMEISLWHPYQEYSKFLGKIELTKLQVSKMDGSAL